MPGKTNLVLSRFADKTFTAWEESAEFFPRKADVKVTGNPIRARVLQATGTTAEARAAFGLRDDKFTLLVLGGSRGARFLVDLAVDMALSADLDIQMLLITGKEYYDNAVAALGATEHTGIAGAKYGNIIIQPYVYNMEQAYRACDLVLARAGGMTLAEITALGLPSIIVPSPNVVGNHQEYNARVLETAGSNSGEGRSGYTQSSRTWHKNHTWGPGAPQAHGSGRFGDRPAGCCFRDSQGTHRPCQARLMP